MDYIVPPPYDPCLAALFLMGLGAVCGIVIWEYIKRETFMSLSAIEIGCADIKDIRFDERLDINPSPAVTKIADLREPLPYPDATFEFVKGAAVIEHLTPHEQVRLVKELHRVLVPHGVVWIQCPDLGWLVKARISGEITLEWFNTQMSGGQRDAHDFHLGLLTDETLRYLFESGGFRTLQLLDGSVEAGSLDGLFEKA